MITNKINLKEYYPTLENDVYLISYCPENYLEFSNNRHRKCVVILPGGGYEFLSERESEPVALRFAGYDIASFVLKYSIKPKIKYPNPYVEVYAALAYIRKNAELYHVDVNAISVIGFSAGGHLAATCSAFHQEEEFAKLLNIDLQEMKINGCILGYPVISTSFGHQNTIKNATAGKPELIEKLSVENHVTPAFPKTFIWHTTFDTCVSLKNSLALAESLRQNNIFFEMHIYPMLDHGQSLADESVYNSQIISKEQLQLMNYNTQWVDNAIHFIKEYI